MIITCPECATRYDLEEDRFVPNGRSVRCTACGESWFVPAPESIDALSRHEPARHEPSRHESARREPPRREARPENRNEARNEARRESPRETRREPRMEPRAQFARDSHRPDDRDFDTRDRFDAEPPRREDARDEGRDEVRDDPHRDHDDRSLRASRPAPAENFRFSEDGRDASGQPEEAEISIVKSADKDLLPPRDEKGRFLPRDASADSDHFDDDEDDTLFDSPAAAASSAHHGRGYATHDTGNDAPPKGWRKGKQFYVEEREDEPDEDPRPFFAKHFSKAKKDDAPSQTVRRDRDDDDRERAHDSYASQEETTQEPRRDAPREPFHARSEEAERDANPFHADAADAPRHRDADEHYARDRGHDRDYEYDRGHHEARARDEHDFDDDIIPGEATILDADWEDVEEGSTGPHFGRRIREGRRRATALARLEDVRRFEPQMLDEEFFRSLHVTPHELEKAVRKARRRAEARDKNRLTPWRAFGWSAWVAAVAGAAYAVVAYRDEIVRAAPTAADAYAVVGIETDPVGLKIENVNHRLAMSTGGPMIEISGSLRNLGGDALDAPLLQAEALGPRGELLARWTFKSEEPTVAGGDVSAFTTRNAAPEGVSEVALSFAPTQSVVAPR